MTIPLPPDFFPNGFVSLNGPSAPGIVAYGLGGVSEPYVGFYDFHTQKWDSKKISNNLSDIGNGRGALLDDKGSFGLTVGVGPKAAPVGYDDWITHGPDGWTVEDSPLRWAEHGGGGVAVANRQVFAMVSTTLPELWRLDSQTGWQREPPIPGAQSAILAGNGTALQLCVQDQQSNIVLMTRTPASPLYQSTILQPASSPGFGGTVCQLAGQANETPLVSWSSLILRPATPFDQNLYAASYTGQKWQVQNLGVGESPSSMTSTKEGGFLLSNYGNLWRLANGNWLPCNTIRASSLTYPTLTRMGENTLLVGYSLANNTVEVKDLDSTVETCS
jgi:hypothetical protein